MRDLCVFVCGRFTRKRKKERERHRKRARETARERGRKRKRVCRRTNSLAATRTCCLCRRTCCLWRAPTPHLEFVCVCVRERERERERVRGKKRERDKERKRETKREKRKEKRERKREKGTETEGERERKCVCVFVCVVCACVYAYACVWIANWKRWAEKQTASMCGIRSDVRSTRPFKSGNRPHWKNRGVDWNQQRKGGRQILPKQYSISKNTRSSAIARRESRGRHLEDHIRRVRFLNRRPVRIRKETCSNTIRECCDMHLWNDEMRRVRFLRKTLKNTKRDLKYYERMAPRAATQWRNETSSHLKRDMRWARNRMCFHI